MKKPPSDHCTHNAPRIFASRSGEASAYARNRAFRNSCVNVALTAGKRTFYAEGASIHHRGTGPGCGLAHTNFREAS